VITTAVISNGLLRQGDGWQLHPALSPWQPTLLRRQQRWFKCGAHNPLSITARLANMAAASLLLAGAEADPGQWWVVSPWHGQTMRNRVRLLPSAMLQWQEQDGAWLKELLQPLLAPLAMELTVLAGGGMAMHCHNPLDADPPPFPEQEQNGLSNHHPKGCDGGRLMRLLAEIQMLLHQQPLPQHRQGLPAIHGVWLWGAWMAPEEGAARLSPHLPATASNDHLLRRLCDGREAEWMIASADQVSELLPQDGGVPKRVVVTGSDHVIRFESHSWRFWSPPSLRAPKVFAAEASLWHLL